MIGVSKMRMIRQDAKGSPSMQEVADAMNALDLRCTVGHLSLCERGLRNPGNKLVVALAKYYRIRIEDMRHAVVIAQRQAQATANGKTKRNAKGRAK